MEETGLRDPVHNWISLSPLDKEIIDTPVFQRLRHISQLGGASVVYPGGVHSRFSHSIGAMHVAKKYIKALIKHSPPNPDDHVLSELLSKKDYYIKLTKVCALLHDIGHGPFSHAFDGAVYAPIYNLGPNADGGHDIHREWIVIADKKLLVILVCNDIEIDHMRAVWGSAPKDSTSETQQKLFQILGNLIQGPLGADRMDFVLRDSYFTGTKYIGNISYDRIINNCVIHDGVLHYKTKLASDVVQALSQRFFMYDSVYLHKTAFAANLLIDKMLKLSAYQLELKWRVNKMDEFCYLTDSTIIGEIMAFDDGVQFPLAEMVQAKELCKRYLSRDLPKLIEEVVMREETSDPKYQEPGWIRTRWISEIDPNKFEKYNIKFIDKQNNIFSCAELLKKINYVPSFQPFYYYRKYSE